MPSRDLQDLHPVVRDRYLKMKEAAAKRGLLFIVTQTGRTHDEQVAFHAQGRLTLDEVNVLRENASLPAIPSDRNRVITWVTTSVHEFGLGFDVALMKQDGGVHWDTKVDINQDGNKDYDELGEIGEACGLVWGGRFKGRDLVHFEWTGGLTLHELRTGKRPPDEDKKKG